MPNKVSDKVIGRLSLYRRMLERMGKPGNTASNVFSHEIAAMTGNTAALVRRDLMTIGFAGSPKKGYSVSELIQCIGEYLDAPEGQKAVLVGVGNLGRALLGHFALRNPKLPIVAAFDTNTDLANRVIQGCRCYPVHEMGDFLQENEVRVGVITVPASAAQEVADRLVKNGITGIVNFAPVALRVPKYVYIDNIDLTMSLEKAAFFARQHEKDKELV
ncbi:MAG: redox-sensing transcriptional repressor Rex [Candidatus Sumerlaeia bacterium]